MISSKALKEFKEIILHDYGVSITDDQAQELAVTLLRITRVGLSSLARAKSRAQVDTGVEASEGIIKSNLKL